MYTLAFLSTLLLLLSALSTSSPMLDNNPTPVKRDSVLEDQSCSTVYVPDAAGKYVVPDEECSTVAIPFPDA